jgi:PAS domain S-box-containing protein
MARTPSQERARVDRAAAELSAAVLARSIDLPSLADEVLRFALELTGSPTGFVSEIDPSNGDEIAHTLRGGSTAEGSRDVRFPCGPEGYPDLRGWSLDQRRGFFTNEPEAHPSWMGRLPDGHPHLRSFLGVPAVAGEELLGQIAVANAPGGYDEGVVAAVERLAQIYALAILRARDTEALRRSEANYRSIFETAANMITSVDGAGTIVDCNPRSVSTVGYAPEELIGCSMGRIIHPDDMGKAQESLAEILEQGHSFDKEYRMVRKDGGIRHVRINSSSLTGPDGDYERTICIIEDVTEARQAEEERRQLEERMQQAQLQESLGVLAGGVAHDFNNILVSILGTASMARMRTSPGAPLRDELREIEVAATRAAELCDQLLACAGRGQVVRQTLDLNQLLGDMGPLLASSVPKRLELQLELDGAVPSVQADATQLRQVVLNLVINAAEASEDSGAPVTVRTTVVRPDRRRLDAALAGEGLPLGSYLQLEVVDRGVGLESTKIDRLFDPFFTPSSPVGGSASPPCSASSGGTPARWRSTASPESAAPSGSCCRPRRARNVPTARPGRPPSARPSARPGSWSWTTSPSCVAPPRGSWSRPATRS